MHVHFPRFSVDLSTDLTPDLARVFRAEIVAARLEGALRADAALAGLWRGMAAVQEACASAWLEDLSVSPTDLLCRTFRDTVGDPDRDRAALSAAALMRVLHSPGALDSDTPAVLARLWRMSTGEGAAPFDAGADAAVQQALMRAESPILGALAVARLLRERTGGRAPSAERLAFVAADHALRGSGRFMLGEVEPHALVAAPRGAWVLQPSLALVDNGFRLWSLSRRDRVEALLDGLTQALHRGLGSLPMLRRWLDQARAAGAGAHGASRMPDLAGLLVLRPIVNGTTVAEQLRITPRGAQKLIDQAVTLGLIEKITPRARYRAWAITPFARMLDG